MAAKEELTEPLAPAGRLRQAFEREEEMTRSPAFAFTLVASVFLAATPALAQWPAEDGACAGQEACNEEPFVMAGSDQSPVSGSLTLMSDYRFRGISRSDEDPALQAVLSLSAGRGFYAGTRATTLSGEDSFRRRNPALRDLGDVELDLYAGFGTLLGDGFEIDSGLLYRAYVGGDGPTDHFEPYASLSYLIGPVLATTGVRYAPSQDATGNEDLVYLFGQVDVSIPFQPWSFRLEAGHQDWGRFGDYWTWSIGAEHHLRIGGLPDTYLGLRYVDTDSALPGADAGLVASLRVAF